jgi:hypothetical protein
MTRIATAWTYFGILMGLLISSSVFMSPTWPVGTPVIAADDSAGPLEEIPQLAGWVLKGLNWQFTPPVWETEAVIATMREHGANALRRHFASAPLMEANASTRAAYFERWHNVATWAEQNGMWVIYDFYGRSVGGRDADGMRWVWEMPEEDFLAMWRMIAQEMRRMIAQAMRSHANVLLEVGNFLMIRRPPRSTHRDIWMQRCIKAITVMRDAGFTGYIVIPIPEAATWAHPVYPYRQQVLDADPLDRFMWDFHYYWYHHEYQVGTPDDVSLASVEDWLDRRGISGLLAAGDRVLCGEFGVHGQRYDPRDFQWFQNLLTILNRDGYDRIAEAYQPNYNFPQLLGTDETTDWRTLNTQGQTYVAAFPLNLSYYTPPPLDTELPPPDPTPLPEYPREGANKRSPNVDHATVDRTQPPKVIGAIRVELTLAS